MNSVFFVAVSHISSSRAAPVVNVLLNNYVRQAKCPAQLCAGQAQHGMLYGLTSAVACESFYTILMVFNMFYGFCLVFCLWLIIKTDNQPSYLLKELIILTFLTNARVKFRASILVNLHSSIGGCLLVKYT
jgi:hypothetical protein